MQKSLLDIGQEMTCRNLVIAIHAEVQKISEHTYLLAEVADWQVILVNDNADLIHQPYLFVIVTSQRVRARVDVWEKSQDFLSCNWRSILAEGGGLSCRHFGRGEGEASLLWLWG